MEDGGSIDLRKHNITHITILKRSDGEGDKGRGEEGVVMRSEHETEDLILIPKGKDWTI